MEKAIVTFKNPDNNKEISIDLNYNKEESTIDYKLLFSENYSMTDDLDFTGFLANMFLNCLQSQEDE